MTHKRPPCPDRDVVLPIRRARMRWMEIGATEVLYRWRVMPALDRSDANLGRDPRSLWVPG
jgi:hypothetical protein